MADSKGSIAGRSHGAILEDSQAKDGEYYPQLAGTDVHPEVSRAIRTAFDNLYQLRNQMKTMGENSKKPGAVSPEQNSSSESTKVGAPPVSSFATGIHGIQIKAPTDPSTLKNGDTIRYNSKTGQFEFMSPTATTQP